MKLRISKQEILRGNQYLNYVLILVQLIITVLFEAKIISMGILPISYVIAIAILMIGINVGNFLCSKRKKLLWLMSLLSILISAILILGFVAVNKLDRTVKAVTIEPEQQMEMVQMSVYVLTKDDAEELDDIAGNKVGYVTTEEATPKVQEAIDQEVSTSVAYEEYQDSLFLADGLLREEVRAIIMNTAYVDVIQDVAGYEDFANQLKEIYTVAVPVKQAEKPELKRPQGDYDLQGDEDTFVVYLSGIDMWGWVNSRSRSDVNILAVVNTKKGKIQLINTPRDYYVYLPKQDAMDKLTHAGLYGVESSKATLEKLYGIKIDYYVKMNFSGFEAIINSLGGIDVYSQYDFTVDPIMHYKEGYNHVNGLEALAFARERHAFGLGDVQRGINQMEVIKAVIRKVTSPSILTNYGAVLDEVSDCIATDVPAERIYSLVQYQLAGRVQWTVESYTVTGSGQSSTTYSMPNTPTYVMIPDETKVEEAKSYIKNALEDE